MTLCKETIKALTISLQKRIDRYSTYKDPQYETAASTLRVLKHDLENGMFRG